MHCNTEKKTVSMMFPPVNRRRIICDSFPCLKVGVNTLKYVSTIEI